MSHGHVSNITFVYLNIDYHHQGHFFVRESNDSQCQNTGGGVKVIIIWSVHLKNACFWETWTHQKSVKNPRKHRLRLASDSQIFFVGRFPVPFPFPWLCLSYGNDYGNALPMTRYGKLHPCSNLWLFEIWESAKHSQNVFKRVSQKLGRK